MANRLFQTWKHARGAGTSATNLADATNIKAVLVDSAAYTPNTTISGHAFLSDIPVAARLAITPALTSVTWVDATLDAADQTLPDPGGGATGEFLVVFEDTGTATTSRLIIFMDTAEGIPATQDGTPDTIVWAAEGIFKL